jgi:hypothetical protein
MSRDRVIRSALWASVALNLLGVLAFAPAVAGRAAPLLPVPAPRFYAAQVAITIALFCGVYAWLARQPRISRPLVVVGALGKLGFFTLFVVYWAAGDLAAGAVPQAAPDLALAVVFLWWARAEQLGTRANLSARVVAPAASVESTAVGRLTTTAADRR